MFEEDYEPYCGCKKERNVDKTYIVSVELREPHEVAYKTTRRAEKAFALEVDAIVTYESVLTALQTLEAFSE